MEEFSVGELAARTGLTPGVLRTWENRFGFPEGRRKPSGHRRFTEGDVEDVRRVLEARASGVPLRVAIDDVRGQREEFASPSLYGLLGARYPQLQPRRLSRSVLTALSHAIEDECLGRGGAALALGSFQSGDRFGESAARWNELARTSLWAAVLGDFTGSDDDAEPRAAGPHAPALVHLPGAAPMLREWSVVCLSAEFAVALAAWEAPATGAREYEAILSTDREVVTAAARTLAGVAEEAGAEVPEAARKLLAETPAARLSGQALDTERLLLRAMAYLS
ncbi:DICT sensory domain-containing protein [Nocardioides dubius]|uniref:HTH merR-type domain-containing protein n=1 Tax=Nocardioides dubius TaxID=317019 RepID=A0ABN1TMZ7_9ACTN